MDRQFHRVTMPAADVLANTRSLMDRGLAEVIRPDYATANVSGKCSNEVIVEQDGYGHLRIGSKDEPKREPARKLHLKVPCRKCAPCRRARRMLWTDRAIREYRASTRSWFVTLTVRPEERYNLLLQAHKRFRDSGGDFDRLSKADQFAELLREYQRVVALYFMRLRKGLRHRGWEQTRFRYLLVPEKHADGAPHFHVLLHEVDELQPLRKARIEQAWEAGLIHARLLKDEHAARYVVKYLGKQDFMGRVRASLMYGKVAETAHDERHVPATRGGAPPSPLPQDALTVQQRMRDELPDLVGELREGDELRVCEAGLHIGVSCTCKVVGSGSAPEPAVDPADPLAHVTGGSTRDPHSREAVSRRGWVVPMRMAEPPQAKRGEVVDPNPFDPLAREGDVEGAFDDDDTGWIDPSTWIHPDEAEGRVVVDPPGCSAPRVRPPKRA